MTTTAIPHVGVPGLRLVRSEFSKIFSTNAWWLFGLSSVVITLLAMWANMAEGNEHIQRARDAAEVFTPRPGSSAAQVARQQAEFLAEHDLHATTVAVAGSVFTSGQFFGLMLVLLLSTLVMTNEFQYQTATATFLTTPHRTRVVLGKLAAGIGLAMLFWLVTQIISLVGGLLFFDSVGESNSLGEWPIQRAILFNALGYLLWAVFGIGLGTLIRNQIGAVVTSLVVYLVGFAGGIGVFNLIRAYVIHGDWVLTAAVMVPPVASQVMISPDKLYPQSASWWVGALVMAGWALVAGGIGVLLTRRRDIS
ncbi:ABC transporter permease [Longispora sp. K20-0274]|uniref:ABC transporter permease n=1 Tax=Longispora sp. K20-0274 TaxID=3088255 RepID=UPI003999A0FA